MTFFLLNLQIYLKYGNIRGIMYAQQIDKLKLKNFSLYKGGISLKFANPCRIKPTT